MSFYLGPKSFKTTPLTSSNLAFLNSTKDSKQINNDLKIKSNELIQGAPICLKYNVSDELPVILTENKTDDHAQQKELPTDVVMDKNQTSDSSTNSAFSTISTVNTPKSSETSLNSFTDSNSYSHGTLIDLTEEDNKTVILPSSKSCNTLTPSPSLNQLNDESQLIIPSSPLKNYDMVSVSSSSSTNLNEQKAPLLRKKSGELIKSSLKLNTLQRSNSMPNTKSVRFATRLEDVKFFKKSEKPTAVSTPPKENKKPRWDFDSNSSNSSDEETIDDDYLSELYEDILSDDDAEDSAAKWCVSSNDCPYNPLSLNFAKLASNNNVILESVKLNSAGNALIGFVYVKNIAFEKKIIVRLTHDNWNSYVEIENANYISSNHIFKYSDSTSNIYDKFSFIIKLDNLNIFGNKLDLEFCVQYIVNDASYWDNNNDQNYKISLKKDNHNDSSGRNYAIKSSSTKNIDNIFDLEDSNIKLKDNNNFMNTSTSKPLTTDISSLKTSNSFGLKKIRSESSIPTLKSSFTSYNNKSTSSLSIPKFHHNNNLTSLSSISYSSNHHNNNHHHHHHHYNYRHSQSHAPSSHFSSLESLKLNNYQLSKSVSTSPTLKSTTPNIDFTDYDSLIKQFCFFNSDSPSTSNLTSNLTPTNSNSSSSLSSNQTISGTC